MPQKLAVREGVCPTVGRATVLRARGLPEASQRELATRERLCLASQVWDFGKRLRTVSARARTAVGDFAQHKAVGLCWVLPPLESRKKVDDSGATSKPIV